MTDTVAILDQLRKMNENINNRFDVVNGKLGTLFTELSNVNTKITAIEISVSVLDTRLVALEDKSNKIPDLEMRMGILEDKFKTVKGDINKEISYNKFKIENMDVAARRNNLIIKGFTDNENETRLTLAHDVEQLFQGKLQLSLSIKPSNVYRRGPFKKDRCRHIIVKSDTYDQKLDVLKSGSKLKGSSIYLEHDYTPTQEHARYELRTFAKSFRPTKFKYVSINQIEIGNECYKYDFEKKKVHKI